MNKDHILIVDDDFRIRSLLSQYLSKNGYLVTSVSDTKEAKDALKLFTFDLIILDVLLPQELGTDFAQYLRKISQVAILMLTAMATQEERIKGLESGADDYMYKPFDPKELLLRIEKLISRTKQHSKTTDIISLGKTKLNTAKNILIENNLEIALQSSDAKLLKILLENRNQVIDRETLAKELGVNARSIDVQIQRLRNKIEQDPKKPVRLQTIRGKGYAIFVD